MGVSELIIYHGERQNKQFRQIVFHSVRFFLDIAFMLTIPTYMKGNSNERRLFVV